MPVTQEQMGQLLQQTKELETLAAEENWEAFAQHYRDRDQLLRTVTQPPLTAEEGTALRPVLEKIRASDNALLPRIMEIKSETAGKLRELGKGKSMQAAYGQAQRTK